MASLRTPEFKAIENNIFVKLEKMYITRRKSRWLPVAHRSNAEISFYMYIKQCEVPRSTFAMKVEIFKVYVRVL